MLLHVTDGEIVFPESLWRRKLKVAIVFLHETLRFEAWLAGYNKQVQTEYWRLINEAGWAQYRIPPTPQGADSIIECTLDGNPDFADLDALTGRIERGVLKFIGDVEGFLQKH